MAIHHRKEIGDRQRIRIRIRINQHHRSTAEPQIGYGDRL